MVGCWFWREVVGIAGHWKDLDRLKGMTAFASGYTGSCYATERKARAAA